MYLKVIVFTKIAHLTISLPIIIFWCKSKSIRLVNNSLVGLLKLYMVDVCLVLFSARAKRSTKTYWGRYHWRWHVRLLVAALVIDWNSTRNVILNALLICMPRYAQSRTLNDGNKNGLIVPYISPTVGGTYKELEAKPRFEATPCGTSHCRSLHQHHYKAQKIIQMCFASLVPHLATQRPMISWRHHHYIILQNLHDFNHSKYGIWLNPILKYWLIQISANNQDKSQINNRGKNEVYKKTIDLPLHS